MPTRCLNHRRCTGTSDLLHQSCRASLKPGCIDTRLYPGLRTKAPAFAQVPSANPIPLFASVNHCAHYIAAPIHWYRTATPQQRGPRCPPPCLERHSLRVPTARFALLDPPQRAQPQRDPPYILPHTVGPCNHCAATHQRCPFDISRGRCEFHRVLPAFH